MSVQWIRGWMLQGTHGGARGWCVLIANLSRESHATGCASFSLPQETGGCFLSYAHLCHFRSAQPLERPQKVSVGHNNKSREWGRGRFAPGTWLTAERCSREQRAARPFCSICVTCSHPAQDSYAREGTTSGYVSGGAEPPPILPQLPAPREERVHTSCTAVQSCRATGPLCASIRNSHPCPKRKKLHQWKPWV